MKKKEREFIDKFAKRWHEKLRYWGGGYIGWLNVKRMLMIFLRAYKKSPRVTEEFVKEYAGMIDTDPHHCTRENLIGMLTEAGVEVVEK